MPDYWYKPNDFLINYYRDNELNFDFLMFDGEYENTNTLYHFFIQRNLRAGKKLRCMRYLFKTINLLHMYNYYFYNRREDNYRFFQGFSFEDSFVEQYREAYPVFALRLASEYKGKHKTKRKFMYPIYLEREKSRLNELALLFRRISFKYKYRFYHTRLSVILFNFIYYHNSLHDRIIRLNEKVQSVQRRGSRTYVNFDVKKIDLRTEREIRQQLWRNTLARLKVKVRIGINDYYSRLVFKYRNNLGYLYRHSEGNNQIRRLIKLYLSNK